MKKEKRKSQQVDLTILSDSDEDPSFGTSMAATSSASQAPPRSSASSSSHSPLNPRSNSPDSSASNANAQPGPGPSSSAHRRRSDASSASMSRSPSSSSKTGGVSPNVDVLDRAKASLEERKKRQQEEKRAILKEKKDREKDRIEKDAVRAKKARESAERKKEEEDKKIAGEEEEARKKEDEAKKEREERRQRLLEERRKAAHDKTERERVEREKVEAGKDVERERIEEEQAEKRQADEEAARLEEARDEQERLEEERRRRAEQARLVEQRAEAEEERRRKEEAARKAEEQEIVRFAAFEEAREDVALAEAQARSSKEAETRERQEALKKQLEISRDKLESVSMSLEAMKKGTREESEAEFTTVDHSNLPSAAPSPRNDPDHEVDDVEDIIMHSGGQTPVVPDVSGPSPSNTSAPLSPPPPRSEDEAEDMEIDPSGSDGEDDGKAPRYSAAEKGKGKLPPPPPRPPQGALLRVRRSIPPSWDSSLTSALSALQQQSATTPTASMEEDATPIDWRSTLATTLASVSGEQKPPSPSPASPAAEPDTQPRPSGAEGEVEAVEASEVADGVTPTLMSAPGDSPTPSSQGSSTTAPRLFSKARKSTTRGFGMGVAKKSTLGGRFGTVSKRFGLPKDPHKRPASQFSDASNGQSKKKHAEEQNVVTTARLEQVFVPGTNGAPPSFKPHVNVVVQTGETASRSGSSRAESPNDRALLSVSKENPVAVRRGRSTNQKVPVTVGVENGETLVLEADLQTGEVSNPEADRRIAEEIIKFQLDAVDTQKRYRKIAGPTFPPDFPPEFDTSMLQHVAMTEDIQTFIQNRNQSPNPIHTLAFEDMVRVAISEELPPTTRPRPTFTLVPKDPSDPNYRPAPPFEFVYTNRVVYTEGIAPEQAKGCDCDDNCGDPEFADSCACRKRQTRASSSRVGGTPRSDHEGFAYGANGVLIGEVLDFHDPIWECNSECGCPPECINRVVGEKKGISVELFDSGACGWAVRVPLKSRTIKKGTPLGIYSGELMGSLEAAKRDVVYSKVKRTYVYDLDAWTIGEEIRDLQVLERHMLDLTYKAKIDTGSKSAPSKTKSKKMKGSKKGRHQIPSSPDSSPKKGTVVANLEETDPGFESVYSLDAFHFGN
ncbi:histone-lysine N-methyltransferase, partial [Pseudohyphozyma bogoriensis]